MRLRRRYWLSVTLLLGAVVIIGGGCSSKDQGGPKELLDTFFSSAIKQDYATTYTCYYAVYKAKINKEEFIKHRKEASVLQSYKIVSLKEDGDAARAEVILTFAPSEKLKRSEPVSTTVKEDMIREAGQWKIKVW